MVSSSCPLCRKRFFGSIQQLPMNWILMTMDPKLFYKMICKTTSDSQEILFDQNLENIKLKIMKRSHEGYSYLIIRMTELQCPKTLQIDIFRLLLHRLRGMGFLVCENFETTCWGSQIPKMIISWNRLFFS